MYIFLNSIKQKLNHKIIQNAAINFKCCNTFQYHWKDSLRKKDWLRRSNRNQKHAERESKVVLRSSNNDLKDVERGLKDVLRSTGRRGKNALNQILIIQFGLLMLYLQMTSWSILTKILALLCLLFGWWREFRQILEFPLLIWIFMSTKMRSFLIFLNYMDTLRLSRYVERAKKAML